MHKISLFTLSLLMFVFSFSQQKEVDVFNTERQRIGKNSLKILAAYSVANILYGSIASSQTKGSNKYFHQMNAIWNGATLGIISVGYLTAKKETALTVYQALKKQHNTETLFLFNSALDLAYIAGGAWLSEKSKTTANKPERLKGYGQSVMIQGAFLLLFDGIQYAIHNRHGKKLNAFADRLQFSAMGNGIGFSLAL
jgi:hypothetical protein